MMELYTMKNIKNIQSIPPVIFSIITLFAFASIVLLPIDSILIKMSFSDFQSEYLGLAMKMLLIFIIGYRVINEMKIHSIVGLSSRYNWKFKYLNLIPLYLIIIGILSSMSNDLTQIQIENLLLLLFACLTVGFAEEFVFRGLLQSIFLKKYLPNKYGLIISTLIPAIIFGLFHLLNLLKNDNVPAVFTQVVFATFIGFFFGVLVLKTNKIIPVAVTHGLINFFFSIPFLPALKFTEDMEFSIAPILLTLPLFIIGLFVLKNVKKEDVMKRLSESFN